MHPHLRTLIGLPVDFPYPIVDTTLTADGRKQDQAYTGSPPAATGFSTIIFVGPHNFSSICLKSVLRFKSSLVKVLGLAENLVLDMSAAMRVSQFAARCGLRL